MKSVHLKAAHASTLTEKETGTGPPQKLRAGLLFIKDKCRELARRPSGCCADLTTEPTVEGGGDLLPKVVFRALHAGTHSHPWVSLIHMH